MSALLRASAGASIGLTFGALFLSQCAAAAGTEPTTIATLSILWHTGALGAVAGLFWSK